MKISKHLFLLVAFSFFLLSLSVDKNEEKNIVFWGVRINLSNLNIAHDLVLGKSQRYILTKDFKLILITSISSYDLSKLEPVEYAKDRQLVDKQKILVSGINDSSKLILSICNKNYVIKNFAKYLCNQSLVDLAFSIDTLAPINNFLISGNFYCNDQYICTNPYEENERFNFFEISNISSPSLFIDGEKTSPYEFYKKVTKNEK